MAVAVIVVMGILQGSDVVELDNVAALAAALDGAVTRDGQPVDGVGVGGETSATSVLLVTGTVDDDGVLESSLPGGIEGPHVEDVNALHLSDEFKTLETSGLLDVGGDGTGLSTGGDEVLLGLDLCCGIAPVSIVCNSVVGDYQDVEEKAGLRWRATPMT